MSTALRSRPLNRLRVILDRQLTVANLLDKAVAAHNEAPVFFLHERMPYSDLGDTVNPRQLLDFANQLQAVLRQHCQLQRFDRVAVMKANHGDYFFAGLSIMRAGAITVPMNGGISAEITAQYLSYTGARVFFTDAATLQRLSAQQPLPDVIEHILLSDVTDPAQAARLDPRALALAPLMAAARGAQFEPVVLAPDEHCLICHTSGTTGVPKGVLHTSGTLVAGIKRQLVVEPVAKGDQVMSASPFNHFINHTAMLSSLIGQVPMWLVGTEDARAILDLIDREKISVVFCFPHTYQAMYEHGLEQHSLDSVRLWLAGADSSHEVHIKPFVERGAFLRLFGRPVIGSLYADTLGSSEVGFAAFFRFASARSTLFGRYVGRTTPVGPKVKIADENGRALPHGQAGRLMVKGPTLFKGYWNAHDKLHEVMKDGWWWTGDIAYRDGSGRYFHLDRDVDVIRTAQGPLYSLLIEEQLLKYPDVVEAVVLAQGEPGQQQPIALIQPLEGKSIDIAALKAWIEQQLAGQCRLAQVEVVDHQAIPRGLTGKVLKRVLRERYAARLQEAARDDGTADWREQQLATASAQ